MTTEPQLTKVQVVRISDGTVEEMYAGAPSFYGDTRLWRANHITKKGLAPQNRRMDGLLTSSSPQLYNSALVDPAREKAASLIRWAIKGRRYQLQRLETDLCKLYEEKGD